MHPDLIRVCVRALALSDTDFAIVQGRRTLDEQRAIYAQGRETPAQVNQLRKLAMLPVISAFEAGKIVSWTMKSRHLPQADGYGHAIDIGVYIAGVLDWSEQHYEHVAPFFKEAAKELNVPIVWGGDWKDKDRPHFELDRAHYG